MNEGVGARVHVVHLSSGRALEYVRWFRERGQAMTAETTPAYLFADDEDVARYGPFVKINPPLRTPMDRRDLRAGLEDGAIDMVVSDHAPFLGYEKEAGWTDIWSVGSGIPGVELTGRLLWHDALSETRSRLEDVVAWTSERPAEIFGLAGRKGHLGVGADADMVLLDPTKETVLSADTFRTRSRDAIRHVLGFRCRGAIASVWSRGRQVADYGNVVAEPGSGRVIGPDGVSL